MGAAYDITPVTSTDASWQDPRLPEGPRSFVHTTLSSTSMEPAKVPKPQSTPARTRVRSPMASAAATIRSATTSGCSTTLVVESMTPGTKSMPSGSGWRRNARSSCWCRGLASGSESAPTRAR